MDGAPYCGIHKEQVRAHAKTALASGRKKTGPPAWFSWDTYGSESNDEIIQRLNALLNPDVKIEKLSEADITIESAVGTFFLYVRKFSRSEKQEQRALKEGYNLLEKILLDCGERCKANKRTTMTRDDVDYVWRHYNALDLARAHTPPALLARYESTFGPW